MVYAVTTSVVTDSIPVVPLLPVAEDSIPVVTLVPVALLLLV